MLQVFNILIKSPPIIYELPRYDLINLTPNVYTSTKAVPIIGFDYLFIRPPVLCVTKFRNVQGK